MGHPEKSRYFQALKAAGVTFDQHYRMYTEAELKDAYDMLPEEYKTEEAIKVPEDFDWDEAVEARVNDFEAQPPIEFEPSVQQEELKASMERHPAGSAIPHQDEPIHMIAGLSDPSTGEIIRIDSSGRHWLQEEIPKSSIPKPRARVTRDYIETGVKQLEVKDGEYTEVVEVAGDRQETRQVKITLPSYQYGVYRHENMPFTVYVYREEEGFDFFEVNDYFGGEERVPETVKRKYIDTALCYDIRSVVRTIEDEYRVLQLQGKI